MESTDVKLILDHMDSMESRIMRSVGKRFDDFEVRVRCIENLHSEQRGMWKTMVTFIAASGGIGGLAGFFVSWLKSKIGA
jgi:hypothetical protein